MCHTNNQRSFVIKVQIKSNFGRTDTSRHGKPARLDCMCFGLLVLSGIQNQVPEYPLNIYLYFGYHLCAWLEPSHYFLHNLNQVQH